jgi:peptide/nickel transport system permease protein
VIRYVSARALLIVPTLFIVSILTFILVALVPGDPAVRILGEGATQQQDAALDRSLGLNAPVLTQYGHWLSNVLHGNLGSSLFTDQPVLGLLNQRLGVTLSLVIGATLVSLIIGIPLGILGARAGRRTGASINATSWLGFAIPNYWLGLVLVLLLAVKVKLLPATGYVPLGTNPLEWFRSLILPVFTLSLVGITGVAKQTRDSMRDALRAEYIDSLRAAGFSRITQLRHALRNASLPIVTAGGLFFVGLLGGTILVEQVFVLPGLGGLAVQAASDHDLPVLEGVVVYFTAMVIVVNLIVDLSYAWLNPKVRAR